ncbi:MAG: formylglycine-generating enzyme family protein [Bacteroidota bacterium]
MKHILAILFLFLSLTTFSQTIENVTFQQQGDEFIVFYDLLGEEETAFEVSLYYSINGGRTFYGPGKAVSGDIGRLTPAYGRQIRFEAVEALEDMGGPFSVSNFIVRVRATYTPAPPQPDPNHNDPTLDLPADMVYVKGGTFTMGSPKDEEGRESDETQHRVTVSDFLIGKYEVTFEEYDAFCNATGKNKSDDESWGRNRRPAINVSWYDAIEYCNWRSQQEDLEPFYTINKSTQDANNNNSYDKLKWTVTPNWNSKGYRLPTEAEWEYAARGGGKTVMFGNGKDILDPVEANFDASADYKMNASRTGTYRGKTVPVSSLNAPSALGLHDMAGNVYEWCWDWYGTYPTSTQTDPQGPTSGDNRVVRGGGWFSTPRYCRVANRYYNTPADRGDDIGFRLSRHP